MPLPLIYVGVLLMILSVDLLYAAERRGLLDLTVNEIKKDTISVLVRDDDILIRVNDFRRAGLNAVGGLVIAIADIEYISLKSLFPDVIFHIDESDLSLRLRAIPPVVETDSLSTQSNNLARVKLPQAPTKFLMDTSNTGASDEPARPSEANPGTQNSRQQAALLDLYVNGLKGSEVRVILRAGDALTRRADLHTAGLVALDGNVEVIDGEAYVSLDSLAPNVAFKVDEEELTLRLTVSPSALGLNKINLYRTKPANIEYREDTSGFLNYSFNVRDFKLFDTFGEAGLSFQNKLLYTGLARNADGTIVRGLSNLTISQREDLNRTVIGDRLVATDVLGGNLIIGGISYFREFSLDPYFSRTPGLHYSGAVATPSTVDIYVNGLFLRRVQLPPGQFELRDLPVPAGSADTRFVVRDAFGREQELISPFYFTSGLLKKGLHEFSYNLGARRDKLATESWDYGTPVFLGRHRLGITDGLTAGLRIEASPHIASGGPSVSFLLPFGEMELATAVSQDKGIVGGGAFLGYTYGGRLFNFGTSLRLLSSHYATTSLKSSDERSWLQLSTVLSFSVAQRTGISLRYTYEDSDTHGGTQRFVLSTTTRLMPRLNLFVRGGYSRVAGESSNEGAAGLTYLFGDTTGTLSHEFRNGIASGTVSVQKPLPTGTGLGYLVQASASEDRFAGSSLLQYQSPYGRYEAFYGRLDNQDSTVLSAAGGFAFLGGSWFMTRPVQESFAVVQVPGLQGIRGYTNNLEVGHLDSDGNLLVPNLLPYYGNKLSISEKDIPINYNTDSLEKIVAPPYRGGAVVKFPVKRIRRLTGTIAIQRQDEVLTPTYGQLTLAADGKLFESPIGRSGEFYFENLPPGTHEAVVNHEGASCTFKIVVPDSADSESDLGGLRCEIQ